MSEHAFDRAEKAERGAVEFAPGGEARGFSDVAEEHVGFAHFVGIRGERGTDGFLDETFFQTYSQVARHDADEVARLDRSERSEPILKQLGLAQRPSGAFEFVEKCSRFGEGERLGRGAVEENFVGHPVPATSPAA